MKGIVNKLLRLDSLLITLVAYGGTLLLGQYTHIHLEWLPGAVLTFYMPGKYVVLLTDPLFSLKERYTAFAFHVFLSFGLCSTFGLLTLRVIPLTRENEVGLLFLTNGLLFLLAVWRGKRYSLAEWWHNIQSMTKKEYQVDNLILLSLGCVIYATILINPLAQNADGYLTNLKDTLVLQTITLPARQLFILSFASLHYILHSDYRLLYRGFFVVLFYFSTFFLYGYARTHLRSKIFIMLAYLSLLASAVIITEVNIIRPQVAIIALTLPILTLAMRGIEKLEIQWALVAGWLSLVALGYHELALPLGLIAGVAIVYVLVHLTVVEKVIRPKHYIVSALILLPYAKILPIVPYFQSSVALMRVAANSVESVHWQWWFINSYRSADGINIGWPGIQAVYYYVYNGLLFLFFILGFMLWAWIKMRKLPNSMILPIIYVAIYFLIAELLPRVGLFFFPNRAWVHLALPLSLIMVMCLAILERKNKVIARPLVFGVTILLVCGLAGIIYVANHNVSAVFPEEMKAMQFVQSHTSPKSLFISTQDDHTLVSQYADRPYYQLSTNQQLDRTLFDNLITDALLKASHEEVKVVLPEVKEEIQVYTNGRPTEQSIRVIQAGKKRKIDPLYKPGVGVYFVYSLRKLEGLNGGRAYYEAGLDRKNRDILESLGYKLFYKDKYVVILQVRDPESQLVENKP